MVGLPSVRLPRLLSCHRYVLLLLAFLPALYAQPYILENWACPQLTNATSSGSYTLLTCPNHGYTTGAVIVLEMRGATGAWAALNTQDELLNNGAEIAATDTSILLNDTAYVPNGLLQIGTEMVNVASSDSQRVYLSQGSGLGCDTNGRGCTGGPAATTHPTQCGCITSFTTTNPMNYIATVVDSNTFRIGLNSSGLGSFTGQTVFVLRGRVSSDSSPYIGPYTGEGWANYWRVGSQGFQIVIPGCTSKTDAYACSRGFLTPYNVKGYGLNTGSSTSTSTIVVSGTSVTVNFSSAFKDVPANGVLQPIGSNTLANYVGSLVYLTGINESSLGVPYGSLNRPFLVSTVLTSGSNKVGFTATINEVPTTAHIPDGTYAVSANVFMPFPSDGYTDSCPGGCNNANSILPTFIKGGVWNTAGNRFFLYYSYKGASAPFNRPCSGSDDTDLGTYFVNSVAGDLDHGYHTAATCITDSQPIEMVFTKAFQGGVNSNGQCPDVSYDTLSANHATCTNNAWLGNQGNYWNAMNRIYHDDSTTDPSAPPFSGTTKTFSIWALNNETGNPPDEFVRAWMVTYNGSQYNLAITGPLQTTVMGAVPMAYRVSYSPTSVKSAGLSTATLIGTANNNPGLGGAGRYAFINSPNMSLASTMYFQARPVGPVLNVSGSGVSPIQIWSVNDYTFSVGDHVTVAGVGGNTAANQTAAAIVAAYPAQDWWLFTPGDPWGTSHGQLASLVVTGGHTCTVNMNGISHNLNVGQPIYWNGGGPTGTPAVGVYYLSSIGSSTAFSFACSGVTNGTYTTDQSSSMHLGLTVLPSFTIVGTGNGAYSSGGTIVATDDTRNFSEISFSPAATTSTAPGSNPCDLNGDGAVTNADVTISINMALGETTCTGGLQGLGTCTVVDTQRVINAANGSACFTGP